MTQEEITNHYSNAMRITKAIQEILAEAPGTLQDHQHRINSMDFLNARLGILRDLETATLTPAPETNKDE